MHTPDTARSPQPAARPIPQEAFDWYDEYAHGLIDRRTFMARLASLAAAGFAMSTLTAALMPNYALAEQVSFNDERIKATFANFPSPEGHGEGRGYLVVPREAPQRLPAVLVVHENRGLNPYVKYDARRLAVQGYLAFAPDALHPLGGYPGNDDDGRAMQRSMERGKIESDFIAALDFLAAHDRSSGKVGAVGFCFGGYIVNLLAATRPKLLSAGVPFYGTPADASLWPAITGPLMVQLAGDDARVNKTWPDYEAALKAQGADFSMHLYEGAKHGFHNDSTGRYDEAAAERAWERTLEFFSSHLRS